MQHGCSIYAKLFIDATLDSVVIKVKRVALRLRILIANYFLLTRVPVRLELQKRRLRGRQQLSSLKKIIFADADYLRSI